jgi:hypothetical protein
MTEAILALDAGIHDIDRLIHLLKKNRSQAQVRSSDERTLAKATVITWFNNHKPRVASLVSEEDIAPVDAEYTSVLELAERAGSRIKYLAILRDLREDLVRLRSDCLSSKPGGVKTVDQPPDFSPLISNSVMREILIARWLECTLCLEAKAALAATVMMGGLLEAVLLARVNVEPDKAPIFTARSVPKDDHGKAKQLKEWMLSDYIRVVHEMKWISVPVRDVGEVLRDYRNYIHPYKQLSHALHLTPDDAGLFWEVTKNITRQIIGSVR